MMNTIRRIVAILVMTIVCVSGQQASSADQTLDQAIAQGKTVSFPLARVVEDKRPPFSLDPMKPFVIGLGRGSGWEGLNTIRITEAGEVRLYRMRYYKTAEGGGSKHGKRGIFTFLAKLFRLCLMRSTYSIS